MKIHLYTFGWNEMPMLGFFFRHYEPWVDRFVFFDDGSDDGTREFLLTKPNVEVRRFEYVEPNSFSQSAKAMRNHCWKESRGVADWVLIVDVDEHIYHPRIVSYLKRCKRHGITHIPPLGYDMIADTFPQPDELLVRTHTFGAPNLHSNKFGIFDPGAIDEINFANGAHSASPTGRLVLPRRDELLLLHYKQLGIDWVVTRSAALGARLRDRDVKEGWGFHYRLGREAYERDLADLMSSLVNVTDPHYQPSRMNRTPRWWRPGFNPAKAPKPRFRITRSIELVLLSLRDRYWWLT